MECLFILKSRSIKDIINQLSAYKADIVALQEIQWIGNRIPEKRDCTLIYSCDNKNHILGTGFLVSKRNQTSNYRF